MKVFRIDTASGYYDVLTELELNDIQSSSYLQFDEDEIFEIPYTEKQLKKARALKNDTEWCLDFEEEHGIAPDVYDILKHLYNS